jgi:hypothetical protein
MNPVKPSSANSKIFKPVVEIKAVTWDKDSHGLFDYENSYYDMRKFQIAKPVLIGRHNTEINCWSKNEEMKESMKNETEFLLSISQNPENKMSFWVDVPGDFKNTSSFPERNNFLIVRSLKCKDGKNQRGYALKPGETIKLGRVEYKVREIRVRNEENSGFFTVSADDENVDCMSSLPNDELLDVTEQVKETEKNPNLTCRYCFQREISENEIENLLINPCDCKGSSGMVHLICLMNWIQYKIISKTSSNIATYQWKKLQCEVCTHNWPRNIRYKKKNTGLITVEKPEMPYIILERQNTEGDNNDKNTSTSKNNNLSLIVATDNTPIKLGRGHHCDLRISDISVSRIHAFLKYENNQFLIFDNDSKFGTLIKLEKAYEVQTDKAAVQIGRTVFTFVLKNSKTQKNNVIKQEIDNAEIQNKFGAVQK